MCNKLMLLTRGFAKTITVLQLESHIDMCCLLSEGTHSWWYPEHFFQIWQRLTRDFLEWCEILMLSNRSFGDQIHMYMCHISTCQRGQHLCEGTNTIWICQYEYRNLRSSSCFLHIINVLALFCFLKLSFLHKWNQIHHIISRKCVQWCICRTIITRVLVWWYIVPNQVNVSKRINVRCKCAM